MIPRRCFHRKNARTRSLPSNSLALRSWKNSAAAQQGAVRYDGQRPKFTIESPLHCKVRSLVLQAVDILPDRKEASSAVALKALLKGIPMAEATVDWNARPALPESTETASLKIRLVLPCTLPNLPLCCLQRLSAAPKREWAGRIGQVRDFVPKLTRGQVRREALLPRAELTELSCRVAFRLISFARAAKEELMLALKHPAGTLPCKTVTFCRKKWFKQELETARSFWGACRRLPTLRS